MIGPTQPHRKMAVTLKTKLTCRGTRGCKKREVEIQKRKRKKEEEEERK